VHNNGNPIAASDFADFVRWYSERNRRQKGRPLAAATVQTRVGHLMLIARLFGYTSPSVLCTEGQRRAVVNTWFDTLAARMTSLLFALV